MADPRFPDHFSGHAPDYARYRPHYPPALFDYLAPLPAQRRCAWDAGTGNGQAAHGLARHFASIVATDPSLDQLAQAAPHPRIRYAVAPAERTDLPAASVDLATAATAAHWFDPAAYHAELRRVLRPGGVVALWTYAFLQAGPRLDPLLQQYYDDVVGPYWPPERRHVDTCYQDLPFPFDELTPPSFTIRLHWTFETLMGYLGTWSATRRAWQALGVDPRMQVAEALRTAWGMKTHREIVWPLCLRVGRQPSAQPKVRTS